MITLYFKFVKYILKIENNMNTDQSADIIKILFDQACLVEGESIKDPSGFCKKVNELIMSATIHSA